MLAGSELLNAVHRMDGLPKADIVRDCGYVSRLKDGVERLNYTAFYEALLVAKGFHLGQGGGTNRRTTSTPTQAPARRTGAA